MKAVVIDRPGGPEVLGVREVPDPAFGPEEVLVRVRAAGVNRADLLQRRGRYPAPPGVPADVPGLEFAGEIEACGERAAIFRVGDRVMGIVGGGAYAERVATHERACVAVPPALSFEEAGAIPEAFMTADDALHARGSLGPGEAVLVHAAASGVGTACVQLARAAGARVIALSRSAPKRRRLRDLGADHVLDSTSPNLEDAIRTAAGGSVDLVVDFLGASSFKLNLDVLGTGGRLVLVGTLSGSTVEADLSTLMTKRLTVKGTVLRGRPIEQKIALAQELSRRVIPLFATGRLVPVIDRVLPLEAAATAHAAMERNENFGKIVLRVGD